MIIAGLRRGEVTESQNHISGTGCLTPACILVLETIALI
jgi:hypothetical protein